MREAENQYYLGLDIGTDSVGWAVTNENYEIIRKKGKSLWGIRLFDGANTAEERRTFRTNRRRLQRRRQRIMLLQELFKEEMDKVDNKFFDRLRDSAFWAEDKEESQIYSLFNDVNYTDIEYSKEFPTIYHLRAALIKGEKEYDLRLVYLAIHHLMKHRGHFLFNDNIASVTSFSSTYIALKECLEEEFDIVLEDVSEEKFEYTLKNKNLSKTAKCTDLMKICGIDKSNKRNKQLLEIFKLINGLKGSLNVIFSDDGLLEVEHNKIQFSSGNYEEARLSLDNEIQERACIIDIFHSVYNWTILSDILEGGEYEGNSYLSFAKVKEYDKHKKDLELLKSNVKKYCENEYNDFFCSSNENNYCSYIGGYRKNGKKIDVKRCSQEDFYNKGVKKLLEKMPQEDETVKSIKQDIDNKCFMPLQVCKDNGVIPYQINKWELECILKNAEKSFPFLKTVDEECKLTVSEKIIKLFEFRIPYYVGPLNTNVGENCWMVRKDTGAIRPWNFENKVDLDKSAVEFKNRMTNQCTYLQNETVIPKNSLLYSEYMVLNELNNLKIRDEKLPVDLKLKIYNELFKKEKRISKSKICKYLTSLGEEVSKEEITGVDDILTTSLNSYIELSRIFKDKLETYKVKKMAEDIILWITIYGDEKKMLKRVIKNNYGNELDDNEIKALSNLKFQGWGRLSKRFLAELEGVNCKTGECTTIINELRNSQNNLMQILSQDYTFVERINEENAGFKIEGEINYDNLVRDIVASPSIKRAVWQTIQIVEEVKKVMGKNPKRIFVEMARGDEEKKRTTSRKDKLLEAYKIIDKECKTEWGKELANRSDGDLKSIKLYLYYTQMGQCMYSGEKIDLSQLNDATIWDRDHIYPQSKTRDDSLDNLVLVKRTINAKKSDGMISPEIQHKMRNTWKYLKDKDLISDKKYQRLTRTTPLSDEELSGFINRQLVETRQSSKVVATLLKRVYEDTKIIYVKAGAVADFKNHKDKDGKRDYVEDVKVREVNDYHHAKDAYLNIVVGNVYFTKFTDNPLKWIKSNPDKNYSLNRMFDYDLWDNDKAVWLRGREGTRETVNKVLNRNDILYTRYAYCNKGKLFDQQLLKAATDESKAKKLVPVKQGMDTAKYGGYNSVTPSHFMLVESKNKKGELIRTIEVVPLYKAKEFNDNMDKLLQYCKEFYDLLEPRIIIPIIKKNSKLVINGFPMHLKGSTGVQLILQGAVQLCLDNNTLFYIKKIEKYLNENAMRKDKSKLLEIREYDGISDTQNIELYKLFIDKLENSIYKSRPANPVNKLIAGRDDFGKLSLEEQSIVLGEILKLFQCKPVTADLKLIGGSPQTGSMKIAKEISKCKKISLINQSPAGLYENVIDLLKI